MPFEAAREAGSKPASGRHASPEPGQYACKRLMYSKTRIVQHMLRGPHT